MASLMPQGKQQYFDANGDPLSGGKLYTYAAGTSTPLSTYTTAAGNVANTNPVVLDSRGEASIFWTGDAYKITLKTADDVEIWTQDNVVADGGSGPVNLRSFGAIGDGVTNDTSAVLNFLSSGGGYVPIGTYAIDDIDVSNLVNVKCDSGAIFKKRSGAAGRSRIIEFVAGSEGSEWVGGQFDGNKSALSGVWVYGNGGWDDWCAIYVGAERIRVSNVLFKNWLNHPFIGAGDYLDASGLVFKDCGAGPNFGYQYDLGAVFNERPSGAGAIGQRVRGIAIIDCGDVGVAGTLQHGVDFYNPKASTYSDIIIVGLKGAANGLSTYASGLTAKLGEQCTYSNIVFDSPNTNAVSHLAFSFLGAVNCTFDNLRAYNFSGIGLEMLDCVGCTIDGGVIDGNYRSGVTAVSSSIGIIHSVGRFDKDAQSRSLTGGRENTINGMVIRRTGLGASFRSGHCSANGMRTVGHVGTGILVQQTTNTASFPGAAVTRLTRVTLNNCVSEFNGAQGLNVASADIVQVTGGSYSNNGQNTAIASTSRSGIAATTVNRLITTGARLDDDQSFTVSVGASFAAGTTDSNNRYNITFPTAYAHTEGKYITLTNAGGPGVSHTGKIVNMDGDLATIEFSAAKTFSSTGNTTALSGTWTGSDRALTGSGGAASTEIPGTMYVTDGSEWRRVEKVSSNDSIQLSQAFTSPLVGASLSKLVVSVSGIPSQQYGTRLFGGVVAFCFKGNIYQGNVLERMNVSTPGGAEVGSEYFKLSSTTTNATPLVLQGAIPAGHRISGLATNNTIAISGGGATSYELRITDSSNTLKQTIQAGTALTANTKISGTVDDVTRITTGDRIGVVFAGGTPTAGQITLEALYRVDGVPALPSV